jgi:hypothetical protein
MHNNYVSGEQTPQQLYTKQYKRLRRSQKAAEAKAQACGRPVRFPRLSTEELKLGNADYWIDKRRASLNMVTTAIREILGK